VAARELAPGELELRVRGEDWPLRGLTMGGLLRLDDLQRCVETVVEDSIPGDMIEVGTWRGGSSILMRATLDVLGDEDRTVWVADSFQGFPAPVPEAGEAAASEAYPDTVEPYLAAFDFLAVPAQEVRRSFERFGLDHGVELIEGFFEDTLPGLGERRWSLVRLDADTYDSTVLALSSLYDGLEGGGSRRRSSGWTTSACGGASAPMSRSEPARRRISRVGRSRATGRCPVLPAVRFPPCASSSWPPSWRALAPS